MVLNEMKRLYIYLLIFFFVGSFFVAPFFVLASNICYVDEKSDDGISWAINETDFNRKSWIAVHELVLEFDKLKEENNAMKQELQEIKKHLGLS